MKIFISLITILMFACNASEQSNEGAAQKPPAYSKEDLSFGCYRMVVGKDSAIMQLDLRGADSVIGSLKYNRFEKDDNSGQFTGRVDSNKVVGWYKFESEGVITVRQVVFKIIGDKLAEGYGDVSATGDTAYFAYPHTLNYEESHPFEKIACPDSSQIL